MVGAEDQRPIVPDEVQRQGQQGRFVTMHRVFEEPPAATVSQGFAKGAPVGAFAGVEPATGGCDLVPFGGYAAHGSGSSQFSQVAVGPVVT